MPTRRGAEKAYDADLAYVHDAGFGSFAEAAARFLCQQLARRGIRSGKIVELGCGSGIQAAAMSNAGYEIVGYDISPAMVRLAKTRAPAGEFHCRSFLDAAIPNCQVVTAVGEIFNYLFDERNSLAGLKKVFRRVYSALDGGGVFLFDVALVGRIPGGHHRAYTDQNNWACLYDGREDSRGKSLTRRITTFRRDGRHYRRDQEIHRLRLYERNELLEPLRSIGFRVRSLRSYDTLKFPPGYLAFLCHKPPLGRR